MVLLTYGCAASGIREESLLETNSQEDLPLKLPIREKVEIISAALMGVLRALPIQEIIPTLERDEAKASRGWNRVLLRLYEEEQRLTAASYELNRGGSSNDIKHICNTVELIGSLIRELLDYPDFFLLARQTKVRASSILNDHALNPNKTTVAQVLRRTLNIIDAPFEYQNIATPKGVSDLRQLVPQQRVSPIQFAVENGKLVVLCQAAHPDSDDEENVRSSRDALLSNGTKLVEELQRSNCDRRLLQSVAELQKGLKSCKNIIHLGLMNIGVEEIGKAFEAELPDALRGMLLGHTRGIAMYVAQFPEWQKFSEKAAAVELTAEDIAAVSETAKRIASDLERHPEIADDEVPKTIRALQKLIDNPKIATKRAAFAVLRTIENLVAKAFEYCTDLLEKTAEKTVECLSGAASKAIVVTLMTLALSGALGISPLSAKVTDTAWVRAAADIVEKQIEALSAK